METTFEKVQRVWDYQPFLERLLFLMNEFNLEQNEATKLSKLEFKKLKNEWSYLETKQRLTDES